VEGQRTEEGIQSRKCHFSGGTKDGTASK